MYYDYEDEYNIASEQQNRQNRARYQKMNIVQLDRKKGTAIIEGSKGTDYYTVTRYTCTCKDFQKRRQPCKHIYKLCDVLDNPQMYNQSVSGSVPTADKNKIVALLLCIFLGYFGAHYFYVGRWGKGILYFFTIGLFGFGWLYDIYLIAVGRFCDRYGVIL